MMSNVQIDLITDSAESPVTLAEVKQWLRIDHTEDDAKLNELILSAVKTIETHINQPVITKTFIYINSDVLVDNYNKEYLHLPYRPTAIDSVKIYDKTNTANTLTTTSQYSRRVLLGVHGINPRENQAYHVQFQAGIAANASGTPADIKIVVKEVIAFFYEGDCCDKTLGQILSPLSGYINIDQIGLL